MKNAGAFASGAVQRPRCAKSIYSDGGLIEVVKMSDAICIFWVVCNIQYLKSKYFPLMWEERTLTET